MKIQDIMTLECKWISPDTTIAEAARIMRDKDFGFLPVGDPDKQKLIGTVTDRDITIRCIAQGADPQTQTVKEIMTDSLFYCFDDQKVEEVCDNMREVRVRRFPVVNRAKRLVGVVSFGDISQAVGDKVAGRTQQYMTRECADKVAYLL